MTSIDDMKIALVDTSAIVALLNRRDEFHNEAVKIFQELVNREFTLYITNYIRHETHGLLVSRANREIALEFLLDDETWVLERVSENDEQEAINLLARYQDKEYSLTDATSFVMMKRLDISYAVSFDQHFDQYGVPNLARIQSREIS